MAKEATKRSEAAQAKPKAKQDAGERRKGGKLLSDNARTAIIAAALAVIVFAVFYMLLLPSLKVPFSTFKGNFVSAPRVAIVSVYANVSAFAAESNCANKIVYVVANHRNASTIDYYLINQTSCTYPVGGLGHTLSIATNTTANCLAMIGSEPALFLNTSAANSTLIQPYRLYVDGNTAYFDQCPIAVDLS
jgi:hypothetical protein